MAQVDFPNNPSLNQTFVSGNQTWVWDGVKWVVGGSPTAGSPYLPTAGGTMTGPLIAQAAGSKLDGVTIGSVTPGPATFTSLNGGPLSGFRNKLHNPNFRIDQRGVGGGVTWGSGGGFSADRWNYSSSQPSKFQSATNFGSIGALGNAGWLSFAVVASYTPAAADNFSVGQCIEGFNILDLGWGFSGAKPVTLSFLFYSSIAGTHSGSLCNKGGTRSYVFTWNYPTPSVWQYVQVTIPGDTAGTWVIDNTQGMYVRFNMGCGSTYLGPAGAWSGSNFIGATGSIQVVAGANTSSLVIGNVQLEVGPIATPFEWRFEGLELLLCQRYYQRFTSATAGSIYFATYITGGGQFAYSWPISPMRVVPTVNLIGSWTLSNCGSFSVDTSGSNSVVRLYATASATGLAAFSTPANAGFECVADI